MAFKRALWHSGLLYQQTCPRCRTVIRYTDYNLDFRPWYPDGFVYCTTCKGPLRHNENYAINEDGTPVYSAPVQPVQQPTNQQSGQAAANNAFCSNCGKPYCKGIDNFCSSCGTKLN